MGWSLLATQFSCQLAFGVLLAMAFVPRAPVGVLFYRVMGTSAVALVAVSIAASLAMGVVAWSHPAMLGGALALGTYPFYSGPVRGARWATALGLALLGTAVAVGACLADLAALPATGGPLFAEPELRALGAGEFALAVASALATGAVAGSVGLAMVLGHWYLTVPNLAVRHLVRLNRVTIGAMVASAVALVASGLAFHEPLETLSPSLFGATGLFHLSARVAVGLVLPLLFAAMAASSLRYQNTRSATGILYASTVLVLIGAALSVSLQDTYGVPL
ncbi:MAG: hypothetical protein WD226_11715 [Planctomycetota bacterium]